MCFDLLVVRKHCTTLTIYSKQLITYMWVWEPHENMCSIFGREYMSDRHCCCLYCTMYINIFTWKGLKNALERKLTMIFCNLKSKSTVYLLTAFLKRLQILKHEWQEKPSWDQANRRQKLGLVWRIRKKISQIIKDYFYLPFFLLIILWYALYRIYVSVLPTFWLISYLYLILSVSIFIK